MEINTENIHTVQSKKVSGGVELLVVTIFAVGFLYWIFHSITRKPEYENAEWYLVTNNNNESSNELKVESILPYGDDRKNCEFYASKFHKLDKSGATTKCMTGKDVKALKPAISN